MQFSVHVWRSQDVTQTFEIFMAMISNPVAVVQKYIWQKTNNSGPNELVIKFSKQYKLN